MFKKISSLVLSGLISISMVGCGNDNTNEVEYQEPQVQEEVENETTDENLNNEYETKIQTSEVEKAKELLNPIIEKNFAEFEWRWYEDENGLILIIDVPYEELMCASLDSWNNLVETQRNATGEMKELLQNYGIDINFGAMIVDETEGKVMIACINGKVAIDIVNGIDKLN